MGLLYLEVNFNISVSDSRLVQLFSDVIKDLGSLHTLPSFSEYLGLSPRQGSNNGFKHMQVPPKSNQGKKSFTSAVFFF